jgi:hypothetical protein
MCKKGLLRLLSAVGLQLNHDDVWVICNFGLSVCFSSGSCHSTAGNSDALQEQAVSILAHSPSFKVYIKIVDDKLHHHASVASRESEGVHISNYVLLFQRSVCCIEHALAYLTGTRLLNSLTSFILLSSLH